MIRSARRLVSLAFLVALLVAAVPGESHAGAKTLARSVQNLLFFPFDLALSPFVATKATYDRWRDERRHQGREVRLRARRAGLELRRRGGSVRDPGRRGDARAAARHRAAALRPRDERHLRPSRDPTRLGRRRYAEAPFRMKFGVDYLSTSTRLARDRRRPPRRTPARATRSRAHRRAPATPRPARRETRCAGVARSDACRAAFRRARSRACPARPRPASGGDSRSPASGAARRRSRGLAGRGTPGAGRRRSSLRRARRCAGPVRRGPDRGRDRARGTAGRRNDGAHAAATRERRRASPVPGPARCAASRGDGCGAPPPDRAPRGERGGVPAHLPPPRVWPRARAARAAPGSGSPSWINPSRNARM